MDAKRAGPPEEWRRLAIAEVREIQRQFRKLGLDEQAPLQPDVAEFLDRITELRTRFLHPNLSEDEKGRIVGELEQISNHLDEVRERGAKEAEQEGNLEPLMSGRFSREAEMVGLSNLAQLLIADAAREAHQGICEEDWIIQVIKGHQGNAVAWTESLKAILTLREQGPWPWPRELSE